MNKLKENKREKLERNIALLNKLQTIKCIRDSFIKKSQISSPKAIPKSLLTLFSVALTLNG